MATRTKTFGERVQAEREARGWSRDRLARELDVHSGTIEKWENGSEPKLLLGLRVAHLFKWSLAELLELLPKGRFLSPAAA